MKITASILMVQELTKQKSHTETHEKHLKKKIIVEEKNL